MQAERTRRERKYVMRISSWWRKKMKTPEVMLHSNKYINCVLFNFGRKLLDYESLRICHYVTA